MKYINELSILVGCVGGFIANLLGGWDLLLRAMILALVLDYVTGLLKGWFTHTLSSEIGYKGFIKKITILVMIAAAYISSKALSPEIPIREVVIVFFLCNELLSLLENAAEMGVPIPQALKDLLLKQRDMSSKQVQILTEPESSIKEEEILIKEEMK